MIVRSVNVGLPAEISDGRRTVPSGIFKTPAPGRVMAHRLNLDGDGQADLQAHGGEQRAVYAYPFEHYARWAGELGRPELPLGAFGENLTVEGLTEDTVCIGDRFRIGEALLEVTQPRPPCFKLEMRLEARGFAKAFLRSGLVGFYLRVLEEGAIGAGDPIEKSAEGPEQMSVRRISDLLHFERDNVADAERALRIPALSPGWQGSFRERLDRAGAERRKGGFQ